MTAHPASFALRVLTPVDNHFAFMWRRHSTVTSPVSAILESILYSSLMLPQHPGVETPLQMTGGDLLVPCLTNVTVSARRLPCGPFGMSF